MAKIPARTEKAEQLVKEAKAMHGRLLNGQRMLEGALRNQSVSEAMGIIEHFVNLSDRMMELTEELIILEQLQLLGHDLYVRRNGTAIFASRMAGEEVVDLDPFSLLSLHALTQTFGNLPSWLVEIKE